MVTKLMGSPAGSTGHLLVPVAAGDTDPQRRRPAGPVLRCARLTVSGWEAATRQWPRPRGPSGITPTGSAGSPVVSVGLTTPQHRADTFLDPGCDPREGGPRLGDERTTPNEFLRGQRLTLQLKCDGLDAGQLARRGVEPSTMSLLGLVRHVAEVERGWFRRRFAGLDLPKRYQSEADPRRRLQRGGR
jgi:hypothetical protein